MEALKVKIRKAGQALNQGREKHYEAENKILK